MPEDVKPCPFCGNANIEYWDPGNGGDQMYYCEPCGLCGPRGTGRNAKKDALEKWNALPRKEKHMTPPYITPTEDMEHPEVLPCPLCGSPAEIVDMSDYYHDGTAFYVGCSECAIRGGEHDHSRDAVREWNALPRRVRPLDA